MSHGPEQFKGRCQNVGVSGHCHSQWERDVLLKNAGKALAKLF